MSNDTYDWYRAMLYVKIFLHLRGQPLIMTRGFGQGEINFSDLLGTI